MAAQSCKKQLCCNPTLQIAGFGFGLQSTAENGTLCHYSTLNKQLVLLEHLYNSLSKLRLVDVLSSSNKR